MLTLYYRTDCPYSLRVRLTLAEKQLPFVRRRLSDAEPFEELAGISGGRIPALLDDSFGMYDSSIICEYIDEVFPKPPLRLVEPRGRALVRMAMLRIDEDLMGPLQAIEAAGLASADSDEREDLTKALRQWDEAVGDTGHLFGMQFSLVDVWLAAALEWASMLGVNPEPSLVRLASWAERVRARPSARLELQLRPSGTGSAPAATLHA